MDPLAGLGLQTHFGPLDWALVALFMISITAVGIYSRKFVGDIGDFVVAGRAVRTYLGVATMVATEMGLVTVMYSAQKGFLCGFSAFVIAAAGAIVALIVGLTGFIVVPLRKTGAMTIPEFYEQRYGRGVRMVGGAILALSGVLNMGMFLKADCLFMTSITGHNDPTELQIAMTIMLLMVLVYTMLGGMIAVLVTDYLQYVIMSFALVATSVYLMTKVGWGQMVTAVQALRGEAGFNPLIEPSIGPAYIAWMFFLGLVSCALWQTSAIRASSAENLKVVRKTYAWGSVGFLIRFMIPYFWGICALVYLTSQPHLRAVFVPAPGTELPQEVSLRALPIAFGALLPAGAIGLLTAGMLAAAMSTYNSYLHCWASVLTQDVFAPAMGNRLSSQMRIRLAQVVMAVVAVFLLVWGLWYDLGQNLWDYMAVTGAIYFTGAFAVLTAGLYWPKASKAGAYASFLSGLSAIVGLTPIQKLLGVEWKSEYVGLSTVALTAIVMVVVSLLVPDPPKEVTS